MIRNVTELDDNVSADDERSEDERADDHRVDDDSEVAGETDGAGLTGVPAEITSDYLRGLSDDEIAELSDSLNEMSPRQRRSFEQASAEVAHALSNSISKAAIPPEALASMKTALDAAMPGAQIKDALNRHLERHTANQSRLLAQLARTNLAKTNPELAKTMAKFKQRINEQVVPITYPAYDFDDLISPPKRVTTPVNEAIGPDVDGRSTPAGFQHAFEELETDKSAMVEIREIIRKKHESDERLVALFWIVSVAAIVQGVSTLVASDSWLTFGATFVISAVLVAIAVGVWYWRRKPTS